jgi:subtilisin family serine protease
VGLTAGAILTKEQKMNSVKWLKIVVPVLLAAVLVLSLAAPASMSSTDGKTRVWVTFNPGAKGQVERALGGAGAEFHYTFDDLNAFVVSVPEEALAGLSHNPNITLIEEDAPRYLSSQDVPYGIDMVQARDVWDSNRDGAVDAGAPTGAGIKVCVIDSGLYTGHEDLQGVNILGGYPNNWNTDTCGHGTHVVGTIAAANNALGVVGVTPGGASLYIVKVFGDNCAWTYSSTLVDAANRCASAGAKVISMSLGGPTKSTTENRAFDSLNSQGILSIAAAGNAGTSAVEYPAGYASVVSVAAIDDAETVADFSQFNADVEIAAPGVAVKSTIPYIATDTLTVDGTTYSGGHIEYAAYGTANGALANGGLCTATNSAWSGKVVLCQRGDISFYDKVMAVQNSGGAAAVIYNNVSGNFLGTLGEGYSSTIPAISLSMEDGQYLVANKIGATGNLVSNVVWGVSGYEAWDGTSMATPHVSAVAALIWSYNPALTNAQIRTAMTSTAKDLGAAGRDVYYGYGLVQAKNALDYLKGQAGGGTLSATLTTNKPSYVNRETALITATVKDQNAAAVSGATVTLVITTATGTKTTLTGTTDAAGIKTFSYKIATNKGGVGTYTAVATATKTGYTSATATTTFQVTK